MGVKMLFETLLTDTASSDIEGIGTERDDRYGNKYRWIYNASAFASRVGGPACFDASLYASANFLKHVLAAPADEDLNFFAGVFISAIPTLNYGWIMTFGRYTTGNVAQASASSFAVGDVLVPSTLTSTAGTGVAKAYSFLSGWLAAAAWTGNTGAGYLANMMNPSVKLIGVVASAAASGTAPQAGTVFVRGL